MNIDFSIVSRFETREVDYGIVYRLPILIDYICYWFV